MAATLAQFRHYVPEMASTADATVELWLEVTVTLVNTTLFGADSDRAQIWLAAHFIATLPSSGGGGGGVAPVVPGAQSVTVGPVSITYSAAAAAAAVASGYERTAYGLRYQALLAAARLCAASLLMAE